MDSSTKFPIEKLSQALKALGGTQVLVKFLAANDNGKNQVYLAGDISSLGLIPTGEVEHVAGKSAKPGGGSRGPIFRASVNLWWIDRGGQLERAPKSKLIAYPQYPEVRLSGFVSDCRSAPSELFDINRRGREPGRVLVLAPLPDGRVIAAAFAAASEEANALAQANGEAYGVMQRFELDAGNIGSSESLLLISLAQVYRRGWIDAAYLAADGSLRECRGPNCGGVTLETCLGIRANGVAEPDFHGWEIKQHGVKSFQTPRASQVTLMTPEPSGGAYVADGPEAFVRKWGYVDRLGRADRLNFGGVYRVGASAHPLTGLRLELVGYDASTGSISGDGVVALFDDHQTLAASWTFAKLMDHWRRKHARAAFVPSTTRNISGLQYRYGNSIGLGEGAKFKTFLNALATGVVYYDPGIKTEGAGTVRPRTKRRSQFRVDSRKLKSLYTTFRNVDID